VEVVLDAGFDLTAVIAAFVGLTVVPVVGLAAGCDLTAVVVVVVAAVG
jgi:hypothetical protein